MKQYNKPRKSKTFFSLGYMQSLQADAMSPAYISLLVLSC